MAENVANVKVNIDTADMQKKIKELQSKMQSAFGNEVMQQTQKMASSFSAVANSLSVLAAMTVKVASDMEGLRASFNSFLNDSFKLQQVGVIFAAVSSALITLSFNMNEVLLAVNSLNFSNFGNDLIIKLGEMLLSSDMFKKALEFLVEKLSSTQVAFALSTVAASTSMLTFKGLAVAVTLALLPLMKIVAVAGAIAAVAYAVYKSWGSVAGIFGELSVRLTSATGRIVTAFTPLGNILTMPFLFLAEVIKVVAVVVSRVFVFIMEAAAKLAEIIASSVGIIMDGFSELASYVADAVGGVGTWLLDLANYVTQGWAGSMIASIRQVINEFLALIGIAQQAGATEVAGFSSSGVLQGVSGYIPQNTATDTIGGGFSGGYGGGSGFEEKLEAMKEQKQAMADTELAIEQAKAEKSLSIFSELENQKTLVTEMAQEQRSEIEQLHLEERQAAEQQYYDWRMEAEEGFLMFQLEAMETFKNGFAEAFANAITAGEDLGKAIENLGKQIVNMFIQWQVKRMAAAMFSKIMGKQEEAAVAAQGMSMAAALAPAAWAKLVLSPGAGAFATSSLSAGMASAAGIGAMSSMVTSIGGGLQGASVGNLPHLAQGGIVTRPTLAVIGEGRESEAVIPLSKLSNYANGSSSGGANVVYNQYGDIASEREFGDLLSDINDSIFASLRSG